MRKKRLRFLPVGPVLDSKDLREKEVIGALIEAAEMVQQPPVTRRDLKDFREWLEKDYDGLPDSDKAAEAADVIVKLEDILATCVPDYCYFSGPDGHHRSWGVWPDEGAISDGEREGEIQRTANRIDIPARRAEGLKIPVYNLVVNDHGNMTLYRVAKVGRGRAWKEVWSVV